MPHLPRQVAVPSQAAPSRKSSKEQVLFVERTPRGDNLSNGRNGKAEGRVNGCSPGAGYLQGARRRSNLGYGGVTYCGGLGCQLNDGSQGMGIRGSGWCVTASATTEEAIDTISCLRASNLNGLSKQVLTFKLAA